MRCQSLKKQKINLQVEDPKIALREKIRKKLLMPKTYTSHAGTVYGGYITEYVIEFEYGNST